MATAEGTVSKQPDKEDSQAIKQFDVFVSHSMADRQWVAQELVPRLEKAGLTVAARYRDFEVGKPILRNLEELITASNRTIVVITPAWVESEWSAFSDVLVRTLDPSALKRKLLPVILEECELPESIAALESVDFTGKAAKEAEMSRLVRDVRDSIPVPLPWRQPPERPLWERWQLWLWRYRRQVRRGTLAAMLGFLLLAMVFQLPPFHPRMGWQLLSPEFPQAWELSRANDVLLVSGYTDYPGCDPTDNTGLWRSTDQGQSWQAVVVPALRYTRPQGDCDSGAFADFAYTATEPELIYGATLEVGVLRSDDAGATWRRIGADSFGPTRFEHIVVSPSNPDLVVVAEKTKGLYRSQDGGEIWERLDGAELCEMDRQGSKLPLDFRAGALLFTETGIYAGSNTQPEMPGTDGGIYISSDGGNCWLRVDDAEGRYNYEQIALLPDGSGKLLAIVYDHRADEGTPQHLLWLVDPQHGRTRILLGSKTRLEALWVSPRQPFTWYVATDRGEVSYGLPDEGKSKQTFWMLSCIIDTSYPLSCFTDLIADSDAEFPLLLSHNRVYRRGVVSWWRWIWPPGSM